MGKQKLAITLFEEKRIDGASFSHGKDSILEIRSRIIARREPEIVGVDVRCAEVFEGASSQEGRQVLHHRLRDTGGHRIEVISGLVLCYHLHESLHVCVVGYLQFNYAIR